MMWKRQVNKAKTNLRKKINSFAIEGVKSRLIEVEPRRMINLNKKNIKMVEDAIESINQIEAYIQTDDPFDSKEA
jgi:hypothetical protein